MNGTIQPGDTVQRRRGADDLGTVQSVDPAGRCCVRWHNAVRCIGGGTRQTYRTRLRPDALRLVRKGAP